MNGDDIQQEIPFQIVETPSSTTPNSASHKRPFQILHVDDDEGFLKVSKQILSEENDFEIDLAESVAAAFKKLEAKNYDVVVSDYEMPIIDGLEFLKELKQKNGDIPFILFTGKGREEVIVEALNLGADRYVNKNGCPETVYCELADAIKTTIERKKSKALLAESELKYRTVVEKSLQGILIILSSPLRIVFANAAMARISGYSIQELLSLSPEEIKGLTCPEDRNLVFQRFLSRSRGEPAEGSIEFRAVRKDGSINWLEVFSNQIDYKGQPAILAMYLDISKRKEADCALRASEERFRELANSVPELVFESDLTGKMTYVSQRAVDFTGFMNEELEGRNMLDFVAPEDREKALTNIGRTLKGERVGGTELNLFRKDGTTYPALVRASAIISGNKPVGIRGIIIEITERKKVEDELRRSKQKYQELVNGLTEIVFETDISGNLTFCSERAADLSGFKMEELEGHNLTEFVVPEEREKVTENFRKSLNGGNIGFTEHTVIKKDGTTYPALIQTSPIVAGESVTGLRGIIIDITERKKAEQQLRKRDKELSIVNEKLQVIGSLTRHDVANKLMVARANAFLLRKKIKNDPELSKFLNSIDDAINQSAKIFEFSRMYEKIGAEKPTEIEVANSFDEAAELMPNKGVEIINKTQELKVLADSMLRQLFYNLIDNSLKHGKTVTKIQLSHTSTAKETKLIYEDDGIGISVDCKQKIFSNGFTTGGSGLGLKLVKKMIEAYGWSIIEDGIPKKGARFVITIPASAKD